MLCEVVGEAGIERPVAVVRVESEQVVNITSQHDALSDVAERLLCGEHAGVGSALCEPPLA
eukprot:6180005-Pleurochrysis_carterae.AAC.1